MKTPGRPRTSETRDLRENLLRTGRELLGEGGPAVLNIREMARRVGYTYQTSYHYFADREAIFATPVEAGLDELMNRLHEARDKASTEDLRAVVETSGNAYVEFALTNPGVFKVMFRRNMCDSARFPGIPAADKRTRDELGRLAQAITGECAIPECGTASWASVHGLTVLLPNGPMADELSTLEYRLAYARRVNQLSAGALMSSRKGEERDDSGAWFW